MDKLNNNAIHMAMECNLSCFLAKEKDRALRRKFRTLEMEKNVHLEEGQRLKTEVEGTMKGTLEF